MVHSGYYSWYLLRYALFSKWNGLWCVYSATKALKHIKPLIPYNSMKIYDLHKFHFFYSAHLISHWSLGRSSLLRLPYSIHSKHACARVGRRCHATGTWSLIFLNFMNYLVSRTGKVKHGARMHLCSGNIYPKAPNLKTLLKFYTLGYIAATDARLQNDCHRGRGLWHSQYLFRV